jgi:hypothetical protein
MHEPVTPTPLNTRLLTRRIESRFSSGSLLLAANLTASLALALSEYPMHF